MVRAVPQALWAVGLLISFSFCYAGDKAYRATVSKALVAVGNVGFGGVHGVGAVHPLRFLVRTDEAIKTFLRNTMVTSERGMVTAFIKASEPFLLIVGSALAIALALNELAKYVAHQAIHTVTRVEIHKVTHTVTQAGRVAVSVTKAQFNHLTARVARLEHRAVHVAKSVAGTIASPFPRIGRLEKTAKSHAKRITKLEKLLAGGLGVALLIRAMTKLGLGWLRCTNVKKAGKAVCGMNPGLLEQLLLDAALLTVAFNLEEFAKEMQTVTGEAADLIGKWAS